MDDLLALAGGVIVTGFDGIALDSATREALGALPFAGYILFARNLVDAAQARALTGELRAICANPILAVDQEGGRIARLGAGIERLPAMMALGALGDAGVAEDAGIALGSGLRRAGFNLDFAPVLDLALDPFNTVIGTRSFGVSPVAAATLGAAFARGLESAGVAATFKHFPGHGATSFDTHLGPARLEADAQTLAARDLVPFRQCAPRARAIMAAHVAVPALDGDVPASLSRVLLTEILREQWGYDGVCVTDCMQMDAIAAGIGTAAGVVQAIAAGADLALVSHDPVLAREAAEALARAAASGTIPRERLEQAHARVTRLRESLQAPAPFDAPDPHAGIGRRIAARAVTVVRGTLRAQRGACIAVDFGEADNPRESLGVETLSCVRNLDTRAGSALIDAVCATGRRPLVLAYRAHRYENQARAIDALVARIPETIVVSTAEPFDVARLSAARSLAACYGNDALALGGLADVLFDDADAVGRLPIER